MKDEAFRPRDARPAGPGLRRRQADGLQTQEGRPPLDVHPALLRPGRGGAEDHDPGIRAQKGKARLQAACPELVEAAPAQAAFTPLDETAEARAPEVAAQRRETAEAEGVRRKATGRRPGLASVQVSNYPIAISKGIRESRKGKEMRGVSVRHATAACDNNLGGRQTGASDRSSHIWGLLRNSLSKAGLGRVFHTVSTRRQALLPSPSQAPEECCLVKSGHFEKLDPDAPGEIVVAYASNPKTRVTPLIEAVFRNVEASDFQVAPRPEEVSADIDAIQEGFGLQRIRRFYRQIHWNAESTEAEFADRIEPGLKLENVAAHSWHVADSAHLIAGHFQDLDLGRVVLLALLHDKLEIYTGDYDPVGPAGNGEGTHAFDEAARLGKESAERSAAERYLSKLRPGIREWQRSLLEDAIQGRSPEARFVKSIDKLQALAYVLEKKQGRLDDDHLAFTLMYSRKALSSFPRIRFHYAELLERFLNAVASARGLLREELDRQVFGQLELKL